MIPHLWQKSKDEPKSCLMKVKEESEKVALKFNIQKTKIMAPSPNTSWEIDEETMETVRDFISLGSKITAGGDCSHEIKRCLSKRENWQYWDWVHEEQKERFKNDSSPCICIRLYGCTI